MYRFPDPLDEDSLKPLVADERYGDSAHPEYPFYRKFVDRAFALVYPDPPRDGAGNFVIDPRDPPKPQVITGGAEFRPWDDERDQGPTSSNSSWQAPPPLAQPGFQTAEHRTAFGFGKGVENDDRFAKNWSQTSTTSSPSTVKAAAEQTAQRMPVGPDTEYRDAWRNLPAGVPDTDSSLPSSPYARQREREAAGQDDGWPDAGTRLPHNPHSTGEPDAGGVAGRTLTPSGWQFRQDIAAAEGNRNDDGTYNWGKKNPRSGALGKYQLTTIALQDVGWKDSHGNWTEKARRFGVRTEADFLNNTEAQEAAMVDYMRRNEAQAEARGIVDRYAGRTYIGVRGEPITITATGIAAAAHRAGPKKVAEYLDFVFGSLGGTTHGKADQLNKKHELYVPAETRLREFQSAPYPRGGR